MVASVTKWVKSRFNNQVSARWLHDDDEGDVNDDDTGSFPNSDCLELAAGRPESLSLSPSFQC